LNKLVLFDIDGTLLSTGGHSARCLGDALMAVFGATGPMHEYDYSGKTDPQIVRELMRGAGRDDAEIEARRPEALLRYAAFLEDTLRPEHVTAKPGIHALIDALEGDPRVTLALLTGNLASCARTKLRPLGIEGRFGFGAYGSDHEDRYALPAVAIARALESTGRSFAGPDVVIVGDSVHDVLCGRSLGVRAVAVATGRTSMDALKAEGPAAALEDLSDTARAVAAILG
jgi:phosphoglycolate phosphatase-like HAD superfamily hydrolase